MEIQLSSGQGPEECELAVGKLLDALMREFPEIRVVERNRGKRTNSYRSVRFFCPDQMEELAALEGSVQWICRSPYRRHHKRKNWFVDVSILGAGTGISEETRGQTKSGEGSASASIPSTLSIPAISSNPSDLSGLVRFETFRSGGPGGQHVNKVETGVRAIYLPMGLSVVSTEARSQHMNKKLALNRLCSILAEQAEAERAEYLRCGRLEHYRLERGNPVRVYQGMEFRRIR